MGSPGRHCTRVTSCVYALSIVSTSPGVTAWVLRSLPSKVGVIHDSKILGRSESLETFPLGEAGASCAEGWPGGAAGISCAKTFSPQPIARARIMHRQTFRNKYHLFIGLLLSRFIAINPKLSLEMAQS